MPGPRHGGGGRERREKQEKFQTFNRPKVKATKAAASGKVYVDYKDTETLRKLVSGNGKLLTRKRTGVATYSGVTTITTSLMDVSQSEGLNVSEYGNANADVILIFIDRGNE